MNFKGFNKGLGFFSVKLLFVLIVGATFTGRILAQGVAPTCASLTGGAGLTYTQDFDSLAQPPATTSSTVPTGFGFSETGTGSNTTYTVGTGSSTAADTYSLGVAGTNPVTDRAFGSLISNALAINIGGCFVNNTGSNLSGFTVTYDGEEYRLAVAGRTDRLDFQYSTDATSLTTGTYVDVNALDFVTPNTTTAGVKDGNDPANRTAGITSTVSSLNIAPGATFYIRFADANITGNDDTLAIDNFSLTAIPSSGTPTISVNDVSQNEGNAGTTTYSFTVSLSAPAPAGGVTFDIATADNTATAGSDYVAVALVGQMIAAGNQTYTFDVTVNGDATVEPTEAFFVNITNVMGATVADAQGEGTIVADDFNPTVNLSISPTSGSEAGTTLFTATVTASAPVTGDQTVSFALTGGTATTADFTAIPVSITIPNGATTGTATFSVVNDALAEGLETATFTISAPSGGIALGTTVSQTVSVADDDATACTTVLINEVLANPATANDATEYVELRGVPAVPGTPCAIPANTFFVAVEGDSTSTLGAADFVVNVSDILVQANGVLFIKGGTGSFPTPAGTTELVDSQLTGGGALENGTITYLLINSPTTPIVEGTDYDANNDGTLEALPADATVLDSVGYTDGGAGDLVYSPAALSTDAPDVIVRFSNNNTPSSAASFYYGNILDTNGTNTQTTIDPAGASPNLPANAAATPGRGNFAPTASSATISGRIRHANGRGLAYVEVTLTGSLGDVYYATTGENGRYSFSDLPSGNTYIVSVSAKRYRFSEPTRVVNLNENLTDVDFIGEGR